MKHISCLLLNVRSIKKENAVDIIHTFANRNNIQAVCLVETWLTQGVTDAELSGGGAFSVFRKDRKGRGGGVLILVRSGLQCTQIPRDTANELLCVDIRSHRSAFRLLLAYSPNTGGADAELEAMGSLTAEMEAASDSEVPSVIMGDFNCRNIKWGSETLTEGCTPRERILCDFVSMNGFEQKVLVPTRPSSESILDLVICPGEMIRDEDVEVIASPVNSDHRAVIVKLSMAEEQPSRRDPSRDWHKADYEAIVETLLQIDWEDLMGDALSTEEMYRRFLKQIFVIVDEFVPRVRDRRRQPIERSIERIMKEIESCTDEDVLRRLQRRLQRGLHRQRCILERTIVRSRDPVRFFGYASTRLKLRDDLSILIAPDGSKVLADGDKANLLSHIFEKTYLEAPRISPSSTAVLKPMGLEYVEDVDVSEESVLQAITEMKCKWSGSPEGLPAGFYKRAAHGLAKPLSMLYRKSLDEGVVPALYKTAWVAPVHKKGVRADPLNKRPVSLTAVSCKVLEKLICKEILRNAENQGLLSPCQYAYRQGRSTTDGLLLFSNFVANSINEGEPVDVVYTDFKNAFETMPQDLLLSVLPSKGVGSKIATWISDFLRGRSFRVKIRDALSRVGNVTTGCPQGSLMGGMLFLLFIDQIKHIIPEQVETYIYADDVKLAMRVRDKEDSQRFQSVLNDFTSWAAEMGLKLSMHKCTTMHFGTRNQRFSYALNGIDIAQVSTMRDLGVTISDKLEYRTHVSDVVRRAALISSWILRSFALRSPSAYLQLFNSHVVPILTYASPVWNPSQVGRIEDLRRVQERFLRKVEARCGLQRHEIETMDIGDRLKKIDIVYFRKMIRNENVFEQFFDLNATSSRRGFVLSARTRAKTKIVHDQFAWRMTSVINAADENTSD